MRKYWLIGLSCLALLQASGQPADSAKHHTIVPYIALDSYNSFITNTPAYSLGVKGGLEWNEKIKFGIGYYTLYTDIVKEKFIPLENDTFRAELKSHYFTAEAAYVFYDNDPWQFSVPVRLGIGSSFFRYYDHTKTERETEKHSIMLMEATVEGHYKILRWFGIGFGLGYRIMLKNNPAISENFNSPLYYINLKIFPIEIYETIFKNKQ